MSAGRKPILNPAIGCAGMVVLVLVSLGTTEIFERIAPLFYILFAWIFALVRYVQGWNWSAHQAWWFGGLVMLILGAFAFLRTFEFRTPAARLRFRAIAAGLALVWLAILAGMCLGGSIHQIGWLATSRKTWFESYYHVGAMRHITLNAGKWAVNLAREQPTREGWLHVWRDRKQYEGPSGKALDDTFASRLITDEKGVIEQIFIWPRNGRDFQKGGGCVAKIDGIPESYDMAEFQKRLDEAQNRQRRSEP
jgi:hypothetical protein